MGSPIPVLGWDANRDTWLARRSHGIGASDIPALLGFSAYRSPWQVWAEKTGTYPVTDFDEETEASRLGSELEPYLIVSAERVLRQVVNRTDHQLYAHPEHPWRLCSPDAHIWPHGRVGVQLKTAGIASGHGAPSGWDDDAMPLAYELQCQWEMHVMGWDQVELIGLVANRGIVRRTIHRDPIHEADLVAQVEAWRDKHIIGGVEPPLGDADNALLGALYPRTSGASIDLPGAGLDAWNAYRNAQQAEARARREKETHGARLKHLLGDAEYGHADGRLLCTWSEAKGRIDWQAALADVCEQAGVPVPHGEQYRSNPSRRLSVKDL